MAMPPPKPGVWFYRYRLFLELARASLIWERLWVCAWPATSVAALFFVIALLDWLPKLPFLLHSLILIVFVAAFGIKVRGGIEGFRAVDEFTAERRLERDSQLDHRPFAALKDRLAVGFETSDMKFLWQAHLVRMNKAASILRVRWPSPCLAQIDPYGLRAVVGLFLVIGLAAAGGDARERLERALVPTLHTGLLGPFKINVWLTPPAYTSIAPIFLKGPSALLKNIGNEKVGVSVQSFARAPVRVPVGSILLAHAEGLEDMPELVIGGRTLKFLAISDVEKIAGKASDRAISSRVQTVLQSADTISKNLEVRLNGHSLVLWPLQVVADRPPEVEFMRVPERAGRALLHIEYEARDDYGLSNLRVIIRHPEGLSVPGKDSQDKNSNSISAELSLKRLGSKKVQGSTLQNFSSHPWAGLEVLIELQAEDARGQTGGSGVVKAVLPERVFNHPVARAVVDARKRLNKPDIETVDRVVGIIHALIKNPDHFFNDTVVFLALSIVTSRLIHDNTDKEIGEVQTLLWETALRIEDGEFSIAERDFRNLLEQIQHALKGGQDKAEIERFTNKLSMALDKYVDALAEHFEKQGLDEKAKVINSTAVDHRGLQKMIKELRELVNIGFLEAARFQLSNLQLMLESIRNNIQPSKPNKQVGMAMRLMKNLRNLTQHQQRALEENYERFQKSRSKSTVGKRLRKGQNRQRNTEEDAAGAREQQKLRRDLGKLMPGIIELIGGVPKALGQVEQAMKDAIGTLNDGDMRKAVEAQTRALDLLRQGVSRLAEQTAKYLVGRFGSWQGHQGKITGSRSDPFGRRPGGALGAFVDDGGIKPPNKLERLQVQEILDELRRRAGERQRSIHERRYIDRLLEQF